MATAENTDQAAHVHLSLVRNYTACPEMLFDKDSIIKRHMNIRAELNVRHCLKIGAECINSGGRSSCTSVMCDQ